MNELTRLLLSLWLGILATRMPTSPPSISSHVERVKYQLGNSYLVVEFLADDLVHLEMSAFGPGPDVGQALYTTPMVANRDYVGPSSLTNDQNGTLETPDLRVKVHSDTLCLTFEDKTKEPDLVLTTLCPLNLDQPWKGITFTPESFTHAYGLGQQFLHAGTADGDWVGRVRSPGGEMGNAVVDWNGGTVGNTQFPVVYLAGKGMDSYAMFVDNAYKQRWDFTGNPWRAEMGGDWLRVYIMTGPDLQDLRRDYMDLVGRPPVPPKKAFGLWISEYGFDNWAELDDKIRTLRANHFPVDGFVLDLPWFGGITFDSDDTKTGSLSWDKANFPDPEAKIASLQEQEGIGIIAIEHSYIGKNLQAHEEMESRGYLVRECETCGATYLKEDAWWGKGGMIDWTNDQAGAFWHDLKRQPLIDAGVIGHWTDLGEPHMYDAEGWYWGLPGDYRPLHQHSDVHNLLNLKWSQSIYEGYLRNSQTQRPFILSRSGAPGSQRYGVSMWSADIGANLSSLATQHNVQMHMSMSGIDYFGSDIGGFHRDALDGDLDDMYTQWFASGMAFDIPARTHTLNLCNCNETAPDRVGDLDSNLENVRQRYELSPYLYSLAHRAYLYGEPVVPPLVYYYQDDPAVRVMGNEKLLGRDLLVAIVAANGETERSVYLPKGVWVDYYTNERYYSSGQWFGPFPEYREDKFKLPMFARAGAIIPQMYVDDKTMNVLGKRSDGSTHDELIVRVYADPRLSSFILFEDDGQTTSYQQGEVRTTAIVQQQGMDRIDVAIGGAWGSYAGAPTSRDNVVKLVSNRASSIERVTLNGVNLPHYETQAEWELATRGWYHAGGDLIMAKSGKMDADRLKLFQFYSGLSIHTFMPIIRNTHPDQ